MNYINDKIVASKSGSMVTIENTSGWYGGYTEVNNVIMFLENLKTEYGNSYYLRVGTNYDEPYIEVSSEKQLFSIFGEELTRYEKELEEARKNLESKSEEWLNSRPEYGYAYDKTNRDRINNTIIPRCNHWIEYYKKIITKD